MGKGRARRGINRHCRGESEARERHGHRDSETQEKKGKKKEERREMGLEKEIRKCKHWPRSDPERRRSTVKGIRVRRSGCAADGLPARR